MPGKIRREREREKEMVRKECWLSDEMKGSKMDRCMGWLGMRICYFKIMTTASKNVVYLHAILLFFYSFIFFFYLLRKYNLFLSFYITLNALLIVRMPLLFLLLLVLLLSFYSYCSLNIEFNGQLNWHNVYNRRHDADAFLHRHTQNDHIFFEQRFYF